MTKKRINTATAQNPEVLPAVAKQDEYAERVVNFHVAAGQHASAAVYCAAAAGAVMLQRKKALGWGKGFTKWKEDLVLPGGGKISPRTADNYIALANEMEKRIKLKLATEPNSQRVANLQLLAGQGDANSPRVGNLPSGQMSVIELLAAFDPTKVNDLRSQAIAQAVREVTNEQSLRQLYFAWGIAKPPYSPGGDHGGGKARAEQLAKDLAEHAAIQANKQWDKIVDNFREFVRVKAYVHVKATRLQVGLRSIKDVEDPLRAYVKEELA